MLSSVLALGLAGIVVFGTTAWIVYSRTSRGQALVPYERGPRGKTGLLEFAMIFVLYLVGQILGGSAGLTFAGRGPVPYADEITADAGPDAIETEVAAEALPSDDAIESEASPEIDLRSLAPLLLGAAIGSLLCVLAAATFWRRVAGRGPLPARLSPVTFAGDVSLGLSAFLMTAIPTYALQATLFHFYPQKHPLLEELDKGIDGVFFLVVCFSTIVAAPVVEETLFRGFLLTAFAQARGRDLESWIRVITGSPGGIVTTPPNSEDPAVGERSATSLDAAEVGNPYAAPAADRKPESADERSEEFPSGDPDGEVERPTFAEGLRRTLVGLFSFPVVASAAVFALLHLGQGPAPIPLFCFALMLGYLYRQTGRLTPCVTAHAALNGTTMALAGLAALAPSAPA